MNENRIQKKCYRSSSLILLLEFLAVSFFSGFLLRLPYRLIMRYVFRIYLVRIRSSEILVCHLLGVLIGIVFVMLRYTSVCIDGRNLTVRQKFRKHSFLVSIKSTLETRPIKNGYFSGELRWLSVKSVWEDCPHRFRLYAFSGGTAQKLVNCLAEISLSDMPGMIKSDIVQHSWEGEEKFTIDSKGVIRREWKNVRINSLIWVGVTTIFALILFLSGDIIYNLKSIAVLAAAVVCVLNILFQFAKTKSNTKRCISEISFMGDHLMIDGDHYMIPDIIKLNITHDKVKSRSLYPVQRYITIRTADGKHKYWAGSEESIAAFDYSNVIRILVLAFVNYPEKIKYVTKGTFWNS